MFGTKFLSWQILQGTGVVGKGPGGWPKEVWLQFVTEWEKSGVRKNRFVAKQLTTAFVSHKVLSPS